jgi:cytochrome c oxidase assembly protein subunit 15
MMAASSIVDWAPALRLSLLAALLAIVPLANVWLRGRGAAPADRLAALTALTLFLTFDLVVFGSFTRLTDSGLGCPDWPGCYGSASPLGASGEIAAAEQAMPSGPVTWSKAHRCDMIVLVTHGRGAFGEFLFGSQTKAVLAGSRLPLLILH